LALPYLEQQNIYFAINFGQSARFFHPENTTAMRAKIGLFQCPSDFDRLNIDEGSTNYAANHGTTLNTFDATPNGPFVSVPEAPIVRISGITDGTSNTAAFSEKVKGIGRFNLVPDRLSPPASYIAVPGPIPANDTPTYFSACQAASPATSPLYIPTQGPVFSMGAFWYSGHPWACYYNQVMPPNTWSCAYFHSIVRGGFRLSNHFDGAVTAASRHPGVVNVLMCDGSVKAIKNTIAPAVWRALGTRAGGEAISADAY
jgi:prepilin-type processing-associated H-X9-DG protein